MNRRNFLVQSSLLALLHSTGLLKSSTAQALSTPPSENEVANPLHYGVLSLIGSALDVVVFQSGTGSHLDQNIHRAWQLPEPVFDAQALQVLQEAIKQMQPQADVQLFGGKLPQAFQKPEDVVDTQRLKLPDETIAALRKDGAQQLLLLTRHRSEARLSTTTGYIGDGKLEGLGFYLDGQKRLRRSDNQEVGHGFLAPFVHLRLSRVDLSSKQVLKQRDISVGTTLSVARAKDGLNPWEVLSDDKKLDMLGQMMRRELSQAASEVLS